jgi:hypothetical protein
MSRLDLEPGVEPTRHVFAKLKQRWIATFYPTAAMPAPGATA